MTAFEGRVAHDAYAIEAQLDLFERFGEQFERELLEFAGLIFKPDGLVARRVAPGMEIVEELGFVPFACARVRFNRNIVREQWRAAGLLDVPQVLRNLVDRLFASGDSLYVLLRRRRTDERDASGVLHELKGPSNPARRKPHHLRRRLNSERALLSFVHAADSTEDLVRELGLFFSHDERRSLLCSSQEAFAPRMSALTRALYSQHPEHDLDLAASRRRIIAACRDRRIHELDRRLAAGPGEVEALFEELQDRNIEVNIWDRIVIEDEAARGLGF